MARRLPQFIIDRVVQYKTQKFEDIVIDGNFIVSGYVEDLVGITNNYSTLQYASKGVFIKNDSVCWGGICYNPELCIGAKNASTVISSWEWFLTKLKVDKKKFSSEIEKTAVLDWIITGRSTIYLPKILNLAVDLLRLERMGVDVSKKLFEINKNIKGNFKKAKKLIKKSEIDIRYKSTAHYLADLSVEAKIAVIAKLLKYDTELHMAHDVLIDCKKIQVKNIRKTMNPQTIVNAIERGFEHDADIVVIGHDIPLDGEGIKKITKGKWYAETFSIYEGLDMAMVLCAKGKRVVFFITGILKGYYTRLLILN